MQAVRIADQARVIFPDGQLATGEIWRLDTGIVLAAFEEVPSTIDMPSPYAAIDVPRTQYEDNGSWFVRKDADGKPAFQGLPAEVVQIIKSQRD